jgi:hypothetical protein
MAGEVVLCEKHTYQHHTRNNTEGCSKGERRHPSNTRKPTEMRWELGI